MIIFDKNIIGNLMELKMVMACAGSFTAKDNKTPMDENCKAAHTIVNANNSRLCGGIERKIQTIARVVVSDRSPKKKLLRDLPNAMPK